MAGGNLTRRMMGAGGLAAALALPGFARSQDPAPSFTNQNQHRGLLTAAVMINDRGPYAFAIDSAANTSVIARDLVVGLGLPDAGEVAMHTLIAEERAGTTRVARLRTGALDAREARLVISDRSGLEGLDGLLGTDLLRDLRLVLNFRGRAQVNVARSPRARRGLAGAQLIARAPGEQRFNGLLMVEAMAGFLPCKAIVDTGAQATVINTALAQQGGARPMVQQDGSSRGGVESVTGRKALADLMLLPELQLGGIRLTQAPVLVGDFHAFDLWGLSDQPALLLGLDILSLFQTVVIDLRRGELLLRPWRAQLAPGR